MIWGGIVPIFGGNVTLTPIWLSVQLVSEIACTSDMRRATSRRYAAPAPRAARLLALWYVRVASATQGLGSV